MTLLAFSCAALAPWCCHKYFAFDEWTMGDPADVGGRGDDARAALESLCNRDVQSTSMHVCIYVYMYLYYALYL